MKIYDVFRGGELKASIRIWGTSEIEWTYRPVDAEYNGFWWGNDVKQAIEEMILDYPEREVFQVSDFMIRQRGIEVISLSRFQPSESSAEDLSA